MISEALKKFGYGVRYSLLLSVGARAEVKVNSLSSLIRVCAMIIRGVGINAVHDHVYHMFKDMGMGPYVRIGIPSIGHFAPDDYEAWPSS